MDNLNSKEFECSGCFVCADICPEAAISIKRDDEGFYKYIIDDNKCTQCGLCTKKCPQFNNSTSNQIPSLCYAAYSKDDDILLKSSSGGIFTELAKSIFRDGGLVVGAAWIDNDIRHIFIDNENGLDKLRGSKYLQSNLSGVYKQIKDELNSGRKVLFSGLPCQVTAINNYINHDDLFTVDIVCHGAPSKKVFDKSLKDRFKEEIVKVDFRNKKIGWTRKAINYTCENGKEAVRGVTDDAWYVKYIENHFLNTSCYDCQISKLPRPGDITLGDFWGINKTDEEFFDKNQDKGVSVVIINSVEGQALYGSIARQIISKTEPLEMACKHNPRINKGNYAAEHMERRKAFFNAYSEDKAMFKDDTSLNGLLKKSVTLARRVKRKLT